MAIKHSDAILRLWRGSVGADWLDYNGHMTEHRYLEAFGESSNALYDILGVDFAAAAAGAFYTKETHIRHLVECREGEVLWAETEILGYDDRRLHLFHSLHNGTNVLVATAEHLVVHVIGSRSSPAPVDMLEKVAAIFSAQASYSAPERVGSVLKRSLANSRLEDLTMKSNG